MHSAFTIGIRSTFLVTSTGGCPVFKDQIRVINFHGNFEICVAIFKISDNILSSR